MRLSTVGVYRCDARTRSLLAYSQWVFVRMADGSTPFVVCSRAAVSMYGPFCLPEVSRSDDVRRWFGVIDVFHLKITRECRWRLFDALNMPFLNMNMSTDYRVVY